MTGKAPRIVFMGTPAFAVPSLEACRALGEVVAVLTQPDKPRGRGQELAVGEVKRAAEQAQLTVWQPPRLKGSDVAQRLRALAPDVCVVTAYGKILPPDVLEAATFGCVNVHASLLPRWRGAAPIQWAIAEGDSETGITLMKLDPGLDTGPTFAQTRTPILPTDTAASLHDRLAAMGAALLKEALPGYLLGERIPTPQPLQGITHAPPLTKDQGQLDFTLPAAGLERRIRAFTPWPGAFTWLNGRRLKVHQGVVADTPAPGPPPGEIVSLGPSGLDVACGSGVLRLTQVQPEGKRVMAVVEFLAGHRLAVGDRPFGAERSEGA